MTSARDFYLSDFISKIIQIPQLFSYDLQVKYLSNHTKQPKKLVLYYVLPLFTIDIKSYIYLFITFNKANLLLLDNLIIYNIN